MRELHRVEIFHPARQKDSRLITHYTSIYNNIILCLSAFKTSHVFYRSDKDTPKFSRLALVEPSENLNRLYDKLYSVIEDIIVTNNIELYKLKHMYINRDVLKFREELAGWLSTIDRRSSLECRLRILNHLEFPARGSNLIIRDIINKSDVHQYKESLNIIKEVSIN